MQYVVTSTGVDRSGHGRWDHQIVNMLHSLDAASRCGPSCRHVFEENGGTKKTYMQSDGA